MVDMAATVAAQVDGNPFPPSNRLAELCHAGSIALAEAEDNADETMDVEDEDTDIADEHLLEKTVTKQITDDKEEESGLELMDVRDKNASKPAPAMTVWYLLYLQTFPIVA